MGQLEKRGPAWRAHAAKKEIRKTATFDSKLEALKWIENEEKRIVSGKSIIAGKTFGDLLDKYAEEVSSTKRGKRREEIRIELVKRHKIASIPLESFGSTDVSQWRNVLELARMVGHQDLRLYYNETAEELARRLD